MDLVVAGNAILFVGSGCSLRLKYPSWSQLLSELNLLVPDGTSSKELTGKKMSNGELLIAAEMIKSQIGQERYDGYYKESFGPRNPGHDKLHRNLVNLKFKGFVTTNYDPSLTSALKSKQDPGFDCNAIISEPSMNVVHKFMKSWSHNHWNSRFILYQHGYFKMPTTRVLSYGEYVEKYSGLDIKSLPFFEDLLKGDVDIPTFEKRNRLKQIARRTSHYSTMYSLLATQRVVYMGYGLRDPYLNKITDDMSDDFHVEFDDFHYAIMRVTEDEVLSWNKEKYDTEVEKWRWKGIELVFYLEDNTNTGLDSFIQSFPPDAMIPEQPEFPKVISTSVTESLENSGTDATRLTKELEKKARDKNKKTRESEN